MRKSLICLFVASLLLIAIVAFADKTLPVYKQGDAVYVCACGDGCECKTMSRKEGKCSCGKALGKGVVSKICKVTLTSEVAISNFLCHQVKIEAVHGTVYRDANRFFGAISGFRPPKEIDPPVDRGQFRGQQFD